MRWNGLLGGAARAHLPPHFPELLEQLPHGVLREPVRALDASPAEYRFLVLPAAKTHPGPHDPCRPCLHHPEGETHRGRRTLRGRDRAALEDAPGEDIADAERVAERAELGRRHR